MQLVISKDAGEKLEKRSFPDVLSVRQAREILGIGRVSVYHLIESGKLEAFQKGRSYLIPKSGIRHFLEESQVGGDES